jgi:hypothetical protein
MTGTEKLKVKRIVQELGPDWGRFIQGRITEDAAAYAQTEIERMKDAATRNSISVKIPMSVTMTFPVRDGQVVRQDGGVRCNCWRPSPEVCICVGPGAANCDCSPVVAIVQ